MGYIEVDAQIQYYFYIHDDAELDGAEKMADRTPLLDCTAGAADEPDWLTYRTLLYPDAAKLQTEQNGEHIALMEKHGITDCAYIGDTQGDYEATVEAGVPFIWAAYGFGTPTGYDHKIDTFSDLLRLPD